MALRLNPQFLFDLSGNRTGVLLTEEDWRTVLDELEELDDIRAYDEAKRNMKFTKPFAEVMRDMDLQRE